MRYSALVGRQLRGTCLIGAFCAPKQCLSFQVKHQSLLLPGLGGLRAFCVGNSSSQLRYFESALVTPVSENADGSLFHPSICSWLVGIWRQCGVNSG